MQHVNLKNLPEKAKLELLGETAKKLFPDTAWIFSTAEAGENHDEVEFSTVSNIKTEKSILATMKMIAISMEKVLNDE
jgi:hypothetical protein